jgi:hypothetical protein
MFSARAIMDALTRFFKLDGLLEHVSGYIDARVQLLKLEVREEVAKLITQGLVLGVLLLMAFLFIVFISIAAALVINEYMGKAYIGFLCVAGFYLMVLLVAVAARKPMLQKLAQYFQTKLKQP